MALSANNLTSTIPESLYSLIKLQQLLLNGNSLNGSISESLGSLTQLFILDMSVNRLTGHIPQSIGLLSLAYSVELYDNQLSGPVPRSIHNLTSASSLFINNNLLTGTLPDFSDPFVKLGSFDVSYNKLTGPIPWVYLVNVLYADHNYFNGSLPLLGNHSGTPSLISVSHNTLSGTFPTELLNGTSGIDLSFNLFSGSLPVVDFTFSFYFPSTSNLKINNNLFTGTIPHNLGNQDSLRFVEMEFNFLTGPIPASVSNLSDLSVWDVQNNFLSQTVPSAISQLHLLTTMYLQQNLFSGPLDHVFNATSQSILLNVDVSGNDFTGSIPLQLLSIPGLLSFAAVSNCFSGTIPSEVCALNNLTTLALDGLMAAVSCQQRFMPSWTHVRSYSLSNTIVGTVPACLFQMPNLQTLHLSGNGLTGTLPAVPSSTRLRDLSVSHNDLKGSIPPSVLQHSWEKLDLSYNKLDGLITFSGAFSHMDAVTSQLALEVNRLSGRLAGVIKDMASVNVLDSNMFSCGFMQSELPPRDTSADHYQCGSNSFDYSLYLWIILMGIAMCAAVLGWYVFGPQSQREYAGCTLPGCIPVCNVKTHFCSVWTCDCQVSWLSWWALPRSCSMNKWQATFSCPSCFVRRADWKCQFRFFTVVESKIAKWLHTFRHPDDYHGSAMRGSKSHSLSANLIGGGRFSQSSLPPNSFSERLTSSSFSRQQFLSLAECCQSFAAATSKFHQDYFTVTAVILIVLLPTYYALSHFHSTHHEEYAWVVSSTYLTGETPSIVLMLIFTAMGLLLWVLVHEADQEYTTRQSEKRQKATTSVCCSSIELSACLTLAGILFMNVVVILAVNVVYILIYLRFSSTVVFVTQIVIAVLKLFWNNVVVKLMVRWFFRQHEDSFAVTHITTQAGIVLCNNLVLAFVAAIFLSSNCFHNVVASPPRVVTTYLNQECEDRHLNEATGEYVCYLPYFTEQVTSFDPQFTYTYQCSSTIITTYANVYVYMFVIMTFVTPAWQFLVHHFVRRCLREGSNWHIVLCTLLPKMLRPFPAADHKFTSNVGRDSRSEPVTTASFSHSSHLQLQSVASTVDLSCGEVTPKTVESSNNSDTAAETTGDGGVTSEVVGYDEEKAGDKGPVKESWVRRIIVLVCAPSSQNNTFEGDTYVVQVINCFGILFTFGIVLPPIALVGCIALVSHSTYKKMLVGRYLALCRERGDGEAEELFVESMRSDCPDMLNKFRKSIWIVVPFAALFYALMLFDTLGDAVGWRKALWAPGVMLSIPICISIAVKLYKTYGCCGWSAEDIKEFMQQRQWSVEETLQSPVVSPVFPVWSTTRDHEVA